MKRTSRDAADAPADTDIVPGRAAGHRFSVAADHRMGETGIRHAADPGALIDEEITDMAPLESPPIGAVFALHRLLAQAAPRGVIVSAQSPVRMGDRSEPGPDLARLRARADGYRTPPLPSASGVLRIIEAADTSPRYDRAVKPGLCAKTRRCRRMEC